MDNFAAATLARLQPACSSPYALFAFFSHFQWVAQLTGESAHDHHHDHSSLARRPGVDLPYHLLVRPLHAAGLIWGLKLPKCDLPPPDE